MTTFKLFGVLAFASLIGICAGQQPANFSNPIDDLFYLDPSYVIHLNNVYYMIVNDMITNELHVYKSDILSDWRKAENISFYPFEVPENTTGTVIWGPKFHMLDGHLYLYLTHLETDGVWKQYGFKARNSSDPMGEWEPPVEVLSDWYQSAIDGTVLEQGGKKYLIWNSGHGDLVIIYIAEMTSPLETKRPYNVIKVPSERWECAPRCTSEGPVMLYGRERNFMVITAGGGSHRLTYSSIAHDQDPMDPDNWVHVGEPVFGNNEEESVYNPGHASFTDSPDGTEIWMLYAANTVNDMLGFYPALEKIEWNDDGSPSFPKAHGHNHWQPVPSGEQHN